MLLAYAASPNFEYLLIIVFSAGGVDDDRAVPRVPSSPVDWELSYPHAGCRDVGGDLLRSRTRSKTWNLRASHFPP